MSTTVNYKGNTIATLSNETKTLNTAGTWVEADIVVTDSSSSSALIVDTTDTAGGTIRTITTTNEVHLQTKTITPTSSQQTVLPDTGYDGFSSVIVGASSGGGSSSSYTRTVVASEQTVTPTSTTSNGYTYYSAQLNLTSGLESGEEYIITYNGTEYFYTCTVLWGTNYLLGEINYFYGTTGLPYPFGIIWMSGNTCTLACGDSTAVTVKIEKLEFVGSPSGQSVTGTFTGDNGITVQIPCSFAPDVIYIHGDLTGDVSYRGINSVSIIKDNALYVTSDSSTSATTLSATYFKSDITGYNESNSSAPHASYSNGVLTIDMVENTSAKRFASGITYTYKLSTLGSSGGTPSATAHTIHLEFSDGTDTDIDVYYDNSLIGTMITSYQPSTWAYNNKIVTVAELDSTEWYNSSITWETLYSGTPTINEDSGGNYIYISQNTSISITQNSLWRITWNGTERTHTPIYEQYNEWTSDYCIDGQNDGTNAPYKIWSQFDAWIIPVGNETGSVVLKIERAVTT